MENLAVTYTKQWQKQLPKVSLKFELDGLAHWAYVKMGGVIVMLLVGLRTPVLASRFKGVTVQRPCEFPVCFEAWKLHIWVCGRYRRWAIIGVLADWSWQLNRCQKTVNNVQVCGQFLIKVI